MRFNLKLLSLAAVLLAFAAVSTARHTLAASAPLIGVSLRNDTSPPLRDLTPLSPSSQEEIVVPLNLHASAGQPRPSSPSIVTSDSRLQDWMGTPAMPAPIFDFAGLSNDDNLSTLGVSVLPPDPNGDIGPNHYLQWVNLVFAIWQIDRQNGSASRVYGPAGGNTLWQGFGGICETKNSGDPIALYDPLAARWLMSQPAWDFDKPEYHQCLAISETSDPTGRWHRYDFLLSDQKMNDYPKFGVWPDAYYMTANQFKSNRWAGQGVIAFERDQMLLGQPARMVYFDLFDLDPTLGGMLPADFDGTTPPPAASPGYFLQFDDNTGGYSPDQLRLWQFHVDWNDPPASTFTSLKTFNLSVAALGFNSTLCNAYRGQCIDQPISGIRLESLSDRLMYRLAYRNFGDHAALLVNHTVNANGLGLAGLRWYEIRLDAAGAPTLHQTATFAPGAGNGNADHRWMASLAMDHAGNLALGYTASSLTTYPSIRYAGRLAGDPENQLTFGETTLATGGGAQASFASRWGDYSMLSVDPTDDCTFWYTHEYYPTTSAIGWHTRIGAFRFPSCTTGPHGDLQGTVTDALTGQPIPQARLTAGDLTTITNADGLYRLLNIPTGSYTFTVSAYGYLSHTLTVAITTGSSVQDIAITPLQAVSLGGVVRDAARGWPLYAQLTLVFGEHRQTTFTQPMSGDYQVELFGGLTYTLTVEAASGGYLPLTATIGPFDPEGSAATLDFSLHPDWSDCTAPGYQPDFIYFNDFEADNGAFSITVSGTQAASSWVWGLPTQDLAHSGEHAWFTGSPGGYANGENSFLTSPVIDLSAYAGQSPTLSWWQRLATEPDYDFASLEVSRDGGITWQRAYGEIGGLVDDTWTPRRLSLDPSYAASGFRFRFHLAANNVITAPGWYVDDIGVGVLPPAGTVVYQQDFEADEGGFAVTGSGSWAWGIPTSGPGSAHSGQRVWATSLTAHYANNEDSYLTSPSLDLRGSAGAVPVLTWWQWLETESGFDFPSVEVSRDSGDTWRRVYGQVSGRVDNHWTLHQAALAPQDAVANFRLRFHFQSDVGVTAPGWFVDDVSIALWPSLPPGVCAAQAGGLLLGHVYAQATGLGLIGLPVRSGTALAVTQATPQDLALPDGFYTLFLPSGDQSVTAAFGEVTQTQLVAISPDGVSWQDFYLPVDQIILPLVFR